MVLAWGGHIAKRSEWGSPTRATGSPYHMRAGTEDGPDPTNPGSTAPRTDIGDFRCVAPGGARNDHSIGNQELQFGASEIQGLASLTVIKDAAPDGPQDFTFDPSDNLSLSNFFLDDDGDGTLSNTEIFVDLALGEVLHNTRI